MGWSLSAAVVATLIVVESAAALYVPNKFRVRPYNLQANGTDTTLHITGDPAAPAPTTVGFSVSPIPTPFVIEEVKNSAPATGFNNTEHIARFATEGETTNQQAFGHKFLRSEAWDIAMDLKIETPNGTPRKEAGFYFESSLGNDIFYVATNKGHFTEGPGEIQVQPGYNVLPDFAFASSSGPAGDYNKNGTVDAPDYTVWRDTLGSTTDFRANGTNEGASLDLIDGADYEVWKNAFGQTSTLVSPYMVGDTVNMRMVYTPPVTDPLNPDALTNVVTPGTMEYIVKLNGGPAVTSGPLDFDNPLKGIPDNTFISVRSQSLFQAVPDPDSAKYTFSNFDFNGDAPGSGFGFGGGSLGGIPEPSSAVLACLGMLVGAVYRRRRLSGEPIEKHRSLTKWWEDFGGDGIGCRGF
jgi:hypothetical protein